MDLGDVDWEQNRVLIRHGKGDKERWVGLGEKAASALREYVEQFRLVGEGALFLTSAGQRMASAGTLEVLLRRLGVRVGVKKVHPHRFRHTFATWAIESGAREIDVQMLLGHSDLTTTPRYAWADTSVQAVRAHADLSPVNRLAK